MWMAVVMVEVRVKFLCLAVIYIPVTFVHP